MVYTTRSSASASRTRTSRRSRDSPAKATWHGESVRPWTSASVHPAEYRTYLVLLGGADTLAFRVRVAQPPRPDMRPSLWSHSLLVKLRGPSLRNAQAISVPLSSRRPGLSARRERRRRNPADGFRLPSAFRTSPSPPCRPPEPHPPAGRHVPQRALLLDGLEHVRAGSAAFSGAWHATGNPLHDNYGLPSACMLEIVCAAEDFELTPGLESRVSCPEAIWASLLRHWHEYYEKTGDRKVPYGRYLGRSLGTRFLSPGLPASSAAAPKEPQRGRAKKLLRAERPPASAFVVRDLDAPARAGRDVVDVEAAHRAAVQVQADGAGPLRRHAGDVDVVGVRHEARHRAVRAAGRCRRARGRCLRRRRGPATASRSCAPPARLRPRRRRPSFRGRAPASIGRAARRSSTGTDSSSGAVVDEVAGVAVRRSLR